MATLVSIVYPDKERAQEVRTVLARLQTEYLIDVADAVVVTRDDNGKVHLDQTAPLVEMGAMNGALWGLLIGVLFFAPLLGAAVGAVSGALAGKFSDYGIDDNFMRALGEKLQPNTSALFVLARGGTPERVLPQIAPYGGTLLKTSLPPEAEARLQAALNQGRSLGQEPPQQGLAA
jgi:uncharacterized membrane protein